MTKKLWRTKEAETSDQIDKFLIEEDIVLDKDLFIFDIEATSAHIKGLESIGVLSSSELNKLLKSLKLLSKDFENGSFELTAEFEDCHSAIEFYLIEQLGDLGKKVHTGRSRNDQILVAMRLYTKSNLQEFKDLNIDIARAFLDQAEKNKDIPMPGYTHLQRAMPSSWGLWFASFAESFLDNIALIESTMNWIDANPLGSAAGYGVNLPLNRSLLTKILGFKRKQINSLYIQNSRGKYDLEVIGTLKQSLLDIRRFSWDMSLFLTEEFNLLSIDDSYTTGSSIMPNKKNPDVVEILRAKYSIIAGHYSELENLLSLPSGYHRDLQLTKRSLIHSFNTAIRTVSILPGLIKSIDINTVNSKNAITDEMRMTDYAYKLVEQGIPFREAYQLTKSSKKNKDLTIKTNNSKRSPGSPGNLELQLLRKKLNAYE